MIQVMLYMIYQRITAVRVKALMKASTLGMCYADSFSIIKYNQSNILGLPDSYRFCLWYFNNFINKLFQIYVFKYFLNIGLFFNNRLIKLVFLKPSLFKFISELHIELRSILEDLFDFFKVILKIENLYLKNQNFSFPTIAKWRITVNFS